MKKEKIKEKKSKEKIVQTIAKVLHVISIITFVCLIISFIVGLISTISFIIWGNNPEIMEYFESNGDAFYFNRLLCMLICITVASGFMAVVYFYVKRFYKLELNEGTPYSPKVATSMRKIGIIRIVLSLISLIAVETICVCFNQTNALFTGDNGISIGIVFFVLSYVIEAGIEREKQNK